MKVMSRLLAVLAAASALVGCAGTDFKRPDPGAVRVGKSTQAEVLQVMGAPRQTGELTKNGQQLKQAQYAYANTTDEAFRSGVVAARGMTFFFHNDKLVGQQYLSSFKVDATEFDGAKVPAIVKGKTTKAQVQALLGQPTGDAIYPIAKAQGETALSYAYNQAKGNAFNMKFYNKTLTVSFDAAGVVSDVEYVVNGEP